MLEATFQTVFTVADATSLRNGVQRLSPDLIVLDLSLQECDFQDLLQEISQLSSESRVLVLTVHDQAAVARTALSYGAQGVVLKRSAGRDFPTAVSAILRGENYVSAGFGLTSTSH